MMQRGLQDDPIERALHGPSDPEPIVLQTRRGFGAPTSRVTLSPNGLAWAGTDPKTAGEAPWSMVGGVSLSHAGRGGPRAQIRATDGSILATIVGMFEHGGPAAMLPHIVALYRPELFLELDGDWLNPGNCVRREVADADAATDE
jgi:hypothetical protein